MSRMKAISFWSGGKDSCMAFYVARQAGYDMNCLLNFISKESKRGCFHGIDGGLMKLQAERIGVRLVQKEVSPDMAMYESEFKEAVNELKKEGLLDMVFGDIYLEEHENWVERVCGELGVRAVEPLWGRDTLNILEEFIGLGFKAVIISCKADIMGKEFLGRIIDRKLAMELKDMGICPCGEKGEYHTIVVDGPIFAKPIEISEAEPVLKSGFWKHWFLDIKNYS
ncbi:MAG: diphthine--ammonia ligase [Candidatus Omnitrophica bacterium]|nr:diphthine--ammonia ligase [Candidatus Omnitrophota bacterium]